MIRYLDQFWSFDLGNLKLVPDEASLRKVKSHGKLNDDLAMYTMHF